MIDSKKETIESFRGEYFYLSNFSNYPVTFEGITYKNNESAFQSAKLSTNNTVDPKTKLTRKDFSLMTGIEAKRAGKRISLRNDWEDIKLQVMRKICKAKFSQNVLLKEKLISTGNTPIVEHNSWGDTFWGVSNNRGENHLGKILTGIRSELIGELHYKKICSLFNSVYKNIQQKDNSIEFTPFSNHSDQKRVYNNYAELYEHEFKNDLLEALDVLYLNDLENELGKNTLDFISTKDSIFKKLYKEKKQEQDSKIKLVNTKSEQSR